MCAGLLALDWAPEAGSLCQTGPHRGWEDDGKWGGGVLEQRESRPGGGLNPREYGQVEPPAKSQPQSQAQVALHGLLWFAAITQARTWHRIRRKISLYFKLHSSPYQPCSEYSTSLHVPVQIRIVPRGCNSMHIYAASIDPMAPAPTQRCQLVSLCWCWCHWANPSG